MKIEADDNICWIVFWIMVGAVLLGLVGMAWFAIDRYDKRVHSAIQSGYSIDTRTESGYQSPSK